MITSESHLRSIIRYTILENGVSKAAGGAAGGSKPEGEEGPRKISADER